jgi:hypothetical protein
MSNEQFKFLNCIFQSFVIKANSLSCMKMNDMNTFKKFSYLLQMLQVYKEDPGSEKRFLEKF